MSQPSWRWSERSEQPLTESIVSEPAALLDEAFVADDAGARKEYRKIFEEKAGKADWWVFGTTAVMTVADLVKSVFEWTSASGGDVGRFVGNIGDLETAAAASLALHLRVKKTGTR